MRVGLHPNGLVVADLEKCHPQGCPVSQITQAARSSCRKLSNTFLYQRLAVVLMTHMLHETRICTSSKRLWVSTALSTPKINS